MNIVMGEGFIQRTARLSFALAPAATYGSMIRASRLWWRWGAPSVLTMCLVSLFAFGQHPQKHVRPP
jgi:hypothetical protein